MSNSNESFVRWQGRTIQQLGTVTNLIFGLSLALLAYLTSLLSNDEFTLNCWEKVFYILALLGVAISLLTGLFSNLSRLKNFRLTTRIAREREKGATNEKLKADRERSRKLDKQTWKFFYTQLISFCSSVLFLIILFLIMYSHKIF